MNKQKLKQFMESQGYEEISYKEWEIKRLKTCFDFKDGEFRNKRKEKPQETEFDEEISEIKDFMLDRHLINYEKYLKVKNYFEQAIKKASSEKREQAGVENE